MVKYLIYSYYLIKLSGKLFMKNLKISIITVCLNDESTIKKTIDSVSKQTYKNIEHVIVDGGSTDKTLEIIKKYKLVPGMLISEKDKGSSDAAKKALKHVTGDIVAHLMADDYYANKNVIETVINLFNKDFKLVYGNIEYFDHQKNKLTGRKFVPGEYKKNSYFKGWHAPFPAFFYSKYCIDKFGPLRDDIKISDDFELMFRLQELNQQPSAYLNETITYMGTGGRSGKLINIIIGNFYVIKTLIEHKQKFFIPLYLYRRLFPKIIDKFYLFFKKI